MNAILPSQPDSIDERRKILVSHRKKKIGDFSHLFSFGFDPTPVSKKNCENLIGSVQIPVGIAGPLPISGIGLEEPIFIPLATTEGALVASTNRGIKVMRESGGCTAMVENHGMTRAPVFACENGTVARIFCTWIRNNLEQMQQAAAQTSSHLKLQDVHTWVVGRKAYCRFSATTGEAMGMNMLSIALQHIIDSIILPNWKEKVSLLALSSNVCTDKKENAINLILGRGYWVQTELVIPNTVLKNILNTTADDILQVHTAKNLVGSALAGSKTQNAHVANVVAALFLATGQDPAHVVEASQSFTTFEKHKDGLYAALTIPNINLGTVGGGTYIEAFKEARNIIANDLQPEQLAGVVCAAALAGEISLIGALATHTLACAHQKLGRTTENSGSEKSI